MKTLHDCRVGQETKIVKIHSRGPLKRRFIDMGITAGTPVKVIKVAPLGDPIQINLKGYELTLRKEDARSIEVE